MPSSIWSAMCRAWDAAAGAEAAVVAKRAAPRGHRAVDVGTGEAGVDAHLLHPAAEPPPQIAVVAVIAQTGRLPVEVCRWRPGAMRATVGHGWAGMVTNPYAYAGLSRIMVDCCDAASA